MSIGDFANFSVVEILTLQTLLNHSEPIVRHSLYLEVNQLIQSKEIRASNAEQIFENSLKEISTSSFYNSLKTLQMKGLIKFNYKTEKKKKIETVESTNLTNNALNVIKEYFLRTIVNDFDHVKKVSENIINKLGLEKIRNLMIIWISEIIEFNLIDYFRETSDKTFILGREQTVEDLQKMGLNNVTYSKVINKKIREPNNDFDAVLIPNFRKKLKFFGLNRINLLKESVRILKNDGILVISGKATLPTTENFYANQILNAYSNSISERLFDKKEIENELNRVGLIKIEIVKDSGLIVGIGRKHD